MTADPRIVAFAWVMATACVGVGVAVVLADSPTYEVPASVIQRPSALPGTPVPQPEYAPPLTDRITGDRTVVVGKQVKRGVYATAGGPRCTWATYTSLPPGTVRARGTAPDRTTVDLSSDVAKFETNGCPEWVMVR